MSDEEQTKDIVLCDLCGHEMITWQCELICENCGYRRDCTDA